VLRLYSCLTEQHDPWLLLVAALICGAGAWASFVLLGLAGSSEGAARGRWTMVAAGTTASTTWATHFLAMLAYAPGVPTGYRLDLTLLSLAIPFAANLLAFRLALAGPGAWRGPLAGVLAGLGVASMHHSGMAAYEVGGLILWERDLLAASLLLGVPLIAAAVALGLARRDGAGRAAAAGLLVLGICVVHFVGMAAVVVLPGSGPLPAEDAVGTDALAVGVGLAALAILVASLAGVRMTLRERRRAREEAGRLRALADAALEGLLVTDGETVVSTNRSLRSLLGRDRAAIEGGPIAAILPEPGARMLLLAAGGGRIEHELRGSEGEELPVEIVSRPITYAGRPHHVLAVRDLRDRRQAERQIRFLAHHDPLTGLPNRAAFNERLERVFAEEGPAREAFAVIVMDLDRFKIVNDTLGHGVGDALLVKAARRLRAALRQGDLVCRLGGDEFAIVQTGAEQPRAVTGLAMRLVELLSRPFLIQGQVLNIGASVGIALHPQDGQDAATLARNADLALYRAKAEGRGGYRFFEAEMDTRMQQRRRLEVELRTALAGRQFHLLYQPLLDTATSEVVGFEALVRWHHPERGLISPADFIPIAEETGLIVPIGEWVLREACREATRWPGGTSIAVNLSPLQFRSQGLVQAVRNACTAAGLDPSRLELEITESVLLQDSAATLETLRELKALGARVSMDDFGTGYSSLSYLRSFPFDKIKIDRSFVIDVTAREDAAAIVRAIIGLGRSLGMKTTVEGVETDEQLAHVRAEGCDQVQGYVVSRPLTAEAAAALLHANAAAREERACPNASCIA